MKVDNSCKYSGSVLPGTYLITGSTGFIGSILTKKILESDEYRSGQINIIGAARNREKALDMYRDYDSSHLYHVACDLQELDKSILDDLLPQTGLDYIFHCAANTKSGEMISHPVETAEGIAIGTGSVLKLARDCQIKSMVYLSSMEVYGTVEESAGRVTEEQLGFINPLSARSSYPVSKRMAENFCYSYYHEYGVPIKIARLAQTFGQGVLPTENRIYAQFARCVIKGEDIILHTKGDSVGNYVESEDAVRALLLLLAEGGDGEAYNIANEAATMTILEMAELAADKIAGGKIKVTYDIPDSNLYGYAAKTSLRLSAEKIRRLGWCPRYGMEDMYRRLISSLS